MGTRHSQTVIDKEGTIRVAQYGQWDGYPNEQGIQILEYFRNCNLEQYYEELIKLEIITSKDWEIVNKDKNWKTNYPYLSRDCGSKIHEMIENGKVKFVEHISQIETRRWCRALYTINFATNLFTTIWDDKFTSFNLNKLPSNEKYLNSLK